MMTSVRGEGQPFKVGNVLFETLQITLIVYKDLPSGHLILKWLVKKKGKEKQRSIVVWRFEETKINQELDNKIEFRQYKL